MPSRAVDRPIGLTPSQTVGPFLSIALPWPDGSDVVPAETDGAITVGGTVYDGDGAVIPDGLVETWQCDAKGRFTHPDDPRGTCEPVPRGFRGFGRCATDAEGRWHITTVKPATLPAIGEAVEAPHIDVSVFARGLLDRVVTRIYFGDEPDANAADPVLQAVPGDRRETLIATRQDGGYHLDIHLQGDHETVFFDI